MSWVALLLSITFGCFVIKMNSDLKLEGAMRAFLMGADMAEIEERIARGNLERGNEEHQGLLLSVMISTMPVTTETKKTTLTDEAKRLAEKYKGKRFYGRFFREQKRSALAEMFELHYLRFINAFYLLSLLAVVLLLLTALV